LRIRAGHTVATTAIVTLLAGCGSAIGPAPAPKPDSGTLPRSTKSTNVDWKAFFPTRPGYTWRYTTVAHPTDDPYVDYPGTHTARIESARQESGVTVIEVRDIDSYTARYRFPALKVSSEGVDLVGVDYWGPVADAIDDLTVPFLRFPLKVGARWDDGAWIGKVLKEERVSVPAGTFDTWKLDVIGTHDQAYTAVGYYWVAKGAGIVKSDFSIEGWLIETELKSAGHR